MRRLRRLGVALGIGVVLGGSLLLPGADLLQRQGIDLLLWLDQPLGWTRRPLPKDPPVAVVAIREETYRTPPLWNRPKVAWTPQLGAILDALDKGEAAVIGLDEIYPTTLDRPELKPNYDRPLRQALAKLRPAGKVVLGFAQSGDVAVRPDRGQVTAAGEENLRPLSLLRDGDDVVRRYPSGLPLQGGGDIPSFAAELVSRAGHAPPQGEPLIDFTIGPRDVPLYEFADLAACAEAGRIDFFRREFADRIVIVGSVLDVEDRHTTPRRVLEEVADREPTARCAATPGQPVSMLGRRTTPGAQIHAIAALTFALGRSPQMLPPAVAAAVVGVASTGLGALLFLLAPVWGLLALFGAAAVVILASLLAFGSGIVPPLLPLLLAFALTYSAIYVYRFVVEDRARRRVTHAFRHYLAPALVERLAEDPDGLTLVGETRPITIAFYDIAGFTDLSERLEHEPERLVSVVNGLLARVADAVERHGGYVDKFIGDSVMAVWGAPLPDPHGAEHAVAAGVDAFVALGRYNRVAMHDQGLPPLGLRAGINSGPAVVGNVGSPTRLNYTVLGDAVNLASRLEGANKLYGSQLMIGEATYRALPRRWLVRRLDYLAVKGKLRPVRVYEPIVPLVDATVEQMQAVRRFHAALALYYRRRFAEAAELFAALADTDPAAALYHDRATAYAQAPPPADWDRSHSLTTK
ncbi:adenylate/guanylate cyclase domain-containing protein [Mycobacterium sp. KBS0706]|uniref:adenylate/guanylate cyclase domain-containing protein n=1 Tax=Mycobacterium sp. KBS0706 TaxID=2578109 RepID=UPI00110FE04B|nr:adenylate/guanylate cyclase domain-containing protein [Mycobacterium sp. KBS0706]TSD83338.1 adenylate/guanylate cyclase domain-containing protein [Mycobacterium sp. KBS0706]